MIKQIQDLCLQDLFLIIPKIPGSYLDDLPRDANQVDMSTLLNGIKPQNGPSPLVATKMVTSAELSELLGVKDEFYLITVDWDSTFQKLETFLEMGNLVSINKVTYLLEMKEDYY
jgi:hypothetical protein